MDRRAALWVGAGAIIAAAVGTAYLVRATGSSSNPAAATDDSADPSVESQTSRFTFRPLTDVGHAAAVAELLAQRPQDPVGTSAAEARQLMDHVSEFLAARFLIDGGRGYPLWAEQNGYVPYAWAQIEKHGLLDNWRIWTKRSDRPATVNDLYQSYLEREHAGAIDDVRPAEIAIDRDSRALVIDPRRDGDPSSLDLSGALGADVWHGRTMATMGRLWRPQVLPEEAFAVAKPLRRANMGVTLRSKDGSPRLFHFQFVHDPDGRWRISSINLGNLSSRAVSYFVH